MRYSRFTIVTVLQAFVWISASTATAQSTADEAVAVEAKPKSVLVMDLKYGEGITKDNAFVITQEIATELAQDNSVRVQTVEDTRVTLGVEAQKQVMGCDDSSCLAEIAQAMGTDTLLFGRIDRVGNQVTLQLTLLDASTALPMTRVSAKDKDVGSFLLRMDQVLLGAKRALNPNYKAEGPSALLFGGLAGAGLGTAVLIGGGIVSTVAFVQMTNVKNDASSREQTRAIFFWPSVVVVAVGASVAAAGIVVATLGLSE